MQGLRGKCSNEQMSIFISSVDAIGREWEALMWLCFCSYLRQSVEKIINLSVKQHIWVINKCAFFYFLHLSVHAASRVAKTYGWYDTQWLFIATVDYWRSKLWVRAYASRCTDTGCVPLCVYLVYPCTRKLVHIPPTRSALSESKRMLLYF